MANHVNSVENVAAVRYQRIGSVDDTTPNSRVSKSTGRSNNSCQNIATGSDKFKATNLWNRIIERFQNDMPLKRHRRHFINYDDCFTGKDGVDFMMAELPHILLEGREVYRHNCVALLQKLLNQGLFKRPRSNNDKEEMFHDDNTLYRFCDESEMRTARTPLLMRACSMNAADRARREASLESQEKDDRFGGTDLRTLQLDSSHLSGGFDRRRSMSHGNLPMLLHSRERDAQWKSPRQNNITIESSADSVAETVDSVRAEVNFDLRPLRLDERVEQERSPQARTSHAVRRTVSKTERKRGSPVAVLPENPSKSAVKSKEKTEKEKDKESIYEMLTFSRTRRKNSQQQQDAEKTEKAPPPAPLAERNSVTMRSTTKQGAVRLAQRLAGQRVSTNPHGLEKTAVAGASGLAPLAVDEKIYSPVQVTNRVVTEIDTNEIWKCCLMNRLKCKLSEELHFVSWPIQGFDIRWNCECIGMSGVVKPTKDCQEEFSAHVMRSMRYLEQFPFPSGSTSVITYKDNQEVNVFHTVCDRLASGSTMLENCEAAALIRIQSMVAAKWRKEKESSPRSQASLHYETEFSSATPLTRVISRNVLGQKNEMNYDSSSSTSSSPFSTDGVPPASGIRLNRILEGTQLAFAVPKEEPLQTPSARPPMTSSQLSAQRLSSIQSPDSKSLVPPDPFERMMKPLERETILSLPGVKRSPELLKHLDEMCSPPSTSSDLDALSSSFSRSPKRFSLNMSNSSASRRLSSVTASSLNVSAARHQLLSPSNGPGFEKLSHEAMVQLIDAFALVLLTLPPWRRRRLHHIVRFMNKIASNHCLQLDVRHEKENRYVVLEEFAPIVVECDGEHPITTTQCIALVRLLMDNERRLFKPPVELRREVEEAIRERRRERTTGSEADLLTTTPSSSRSQSSCAASTVSFAKLDDKENVATRNTVQFCEPIKRADYDEQKKMLDDNLRMLLEQIVKDHSLDDAEKKKKLKKFKKTYPEIYHERYPSPERSESTRRRDAQQPGFLSRIFGR